MNRRGHKYITNAERLQLRRYLAAHLGLDELRMLAFDIGADYRVFAQESRQAFVQEFILSCERRGRLSCLVQEALEYDHNPYLHLLLTRLPHCRAATKVQLEVPKPLLVRSSALIEELARRLGVPAREIALMAAAEGLRLLVAIPVRVAQPERLSAITTLLGEPVRMARFETLPEEAQHEWEAILCGGNAPNLLPGRLRRRIGPRRAVLYALAGLVVLTTLALTWAHAERPLDWALALLAVIVATGAFSYALRLDQRNEPQA